MPCARAVYLYRQTSSKTWQLLSEVRISALNAGAQLGKALAMDRSGNRILVSAPSDGTDVGKSINAHVAWRGGVLCGCKGGGGRVHLWVRFERCRS